MATTQTSYKNKRTPRRVQVQSAFQLGSYYTDQEMAEGYAKLLVNYDYADDGLVLKPRMGLHCDKAIYHSDVDLDSTTTVTLGEAHLDGLLYFKDTNDKNQLAEMILSFGQPYSFKPENAEQDYYYAPNVHVAQNDTLIRGEAGWALILDRRSDNRYVKEPYYIAHFKKDINDINTVGYIQTKTYANINIFNTAVENLKINKPIYCNFNGSIYTISTSYLKDINNVITGADKNMRLCCLKINETDSIAHDFEVTREVIEPRQPSLSEATTVGFNMLLDDPYEYPNTQGGLAIKGITPYRPKSDPNDPLGVVLFTANTGETIRFNATYSYQTGVAYQVRWSYKGGDDEDWKVLKDWTAVPSVGADKLIYYDVVPDHEIFSIRCEIREGTDDSTLRLGILPRFKLNVDSLKNLGEEVFDLNTATGMFTFNNMLGLYGVKGAETTIFFSDIENPSYFPFPHNIDTYDEYILKVINYLDTLLVVTTTSIYTITGDSLPSTFVKKKIITNLNITELDAELIKVIKDQVFFKADNTFFVLKPNTYTSDASDLRAYEVSKVINNFLLDFKNNTLKLFNKVYPLRLTEPDLLNNKDAINVWKYNDLNITGYNQHVVDGKLQITLNLNLICNAEIAHIQRIYNNNANLILIYDTLTKQWYFQTYSLLNMCAIRHRRIDTQDLLLFDNTIKNDKNYLLVVKAVNAPHDSYAYTIDDELFTETAKLPNWQLIDTGIVQMNNTLYKRLRELQFTLNNIDKVPIHLNTHIYADGKNVLDGTKYEIIHDVNPLSTDYGHIFVNTYDAYDMQFTGATLFDDIILDSSKFPDLTLVRTHLVLTGKGRFISGEFINRDEKRYELSNILWVYRLMNGR